MQTVIYQLALIIGLGTLAILLVRGYPLLTALYRSGFVLVAVLILLIVAGNILRLGMRSKVQEEEPPTDLTESATENESTSSEAEGT
ncbi:MAG: hypothetical protein JSU61_11825 [Fidelibacterota bacterium]|nr:MAG: hypothetical protein JSU61_11825 [Candidatus Neomarinimicrobiota bacterium]